MKPFHFSSGSYRARTRSVSNLFSNLYPGFRTQVELRSNLAPNSDPLFDGISLQILFYLQNFSIDNLRMKVAYQTLSGHIKLRVCLGFYFICVRQAC